MHVAGKREVPQKCWPRIYRQRHPTHRHFVCALLVAGAVGGATNVPCNVHRAATNVRLRRWAYVRGVYWPGSGTGYCLRLRFRVYGCTVVRTACEPRVASRVACWLYALSSHATAVLHFTQCGSLYCVIYDHYVLTTVRLRLYCTRMIIVTIYYVTIGWAWGNLAPLEVEQSS